MGVEIDRENLAQVLAAITAKYPRRVQRAGLGSGAVPGPVPGTGQPEGSGAANPATPAAPADPVKPAAPKVPYDAVDGSSGTADSAAPACPVCSVDGFPVGGTSAGMVARLELVNVLLAEVLGTDPQAVSPEAWLSVIGVSEGTRRRLDAVYLRSVAAADQCGAAALSGIGTKNVREFLVHGVGVEPGRAKAEVEAARALHTGPGSRNGPGFLVREVELGGGPLALLGTRLAAGDITAGHVKTGVRVLEKVPARIITEETSERMGEYLARQAPTLRSDDFRRFAEQVIRLCRADTGDHYDPESVMRRKFTMGVDVTGMVHGSYQLDPVAGAELMAILDPLSAPHPDQRTPDGDLVAVDQRTADQRRADALTEMARAAGAYLNLTHPPGIESPNSAGTAGTGAGGDHDSGSDGSPEGTGGGSAEGIGGGCAESGGSGSASGAGGLAGGGGGWAHPEVDARARAEAAAAQADDLFSLTPTDDSTDPGTGKGAGTGLGTGTGTGTGTGAGAGIGTDAGAGRETGTGRRSTRCGPSRAGRLRPGRRPARMTITTTFDQLRSFPDREAAILRQTLWNQPPPPLLPAVSPAPSTPPASPPAELPAPRTPADPAVLPDGDGWPGGIGPDSRSFGWATDTTDNCTNDSSNPGSGSSWCWEPEPEREPEPEPLSAPESGLTGAVLVGAGGLTPLDPMPSWCDGLGSISPGTLARMVCDAVFERAVLGSNGALLDLGTAVRLATPAQRRAVSVRDGGCVRPGCNRPASWCDIHHVIWYSRGGPTAVSNMCALCPGCHSLVHAGILEVTMINKIPYLRYGPNARQRPGLHCYNRTTGTGLNTRTGTTPDGGPAAGYTENPWIRNTYHDDLKDAQNFARTIITEQAM
ncbi:HNH endonuclease signature motif containing protein [Arthrobacter sp. H14-L1]|uniref:HNH endonuclease signature motif containing protein n=1 Tax=Arthrobacter sp. H14-L1 TaxID=2996697 RepID=UPI002270471E|nr:HNH endonuclease signature motif containing protein [Arthrobacter sp. H14-L1]MCY0903809.1 DUF222 domain-containing protein [Arthrobacter sp. H14-L1]